MGNPLLRIHELGQSVWYDNLSRELLLSGQLKGMIQDDGVRGVTSNPTIFQRAIALERVYDLDLHRLVDTGLTVEAIYESLVIADIQQAADLLQPLFEESDGRDGFVSLEVSPHLAYDRPATVSQAQRLFERVGRRNLMIKVPATPPGFVAVKELIAAGVNVNVTLIFSLDQYDGAALAYVEGMEEWVASGGDPKRLASVASFFVSRVDTMVDERLKDIVNPQFRGMATSLLGKAATANAKLAYACYRELFYGERFAALLEKGARPQRVLWASTSTKNPAYPDTCYVDNLLIPETVNTMPQATLDAYRDHGKPPAGIGEDGEDPHEVFSGLERIGVDIDEVMERLLEEGVKAFADSYDLLLENIALKRTRLLRGWGHRSASLGALQKRVDESLKRLDEAKISESIWNCDESIWTDDPEGKIEIARRLGWLHSPETMVGEIRRMQDFADDVRSEGLTTAVLMGMGGSSLAPEVFATCLGTREGYLDLKVVDTTVPGAILALERSIDLDRTLFIVASKSGGTVEVMSLYAYFRDKLVQRLGNKAGSRFCAITDPGTSLGKMAADHGFRKIFLNPSDIGGRFSALSYFGLVPAALIGADLERLLMRSCQAVEASGPQVPSLENPGVWLGTIMAETALAGKDKLTFITSPSIAPLGCWFEQLIAESTGKQGTGVLPIDGEPVGPPEAYGQDRVFIYLRLDDEGAYDTEVSALEKAEHPVITLRLHSPYDLGREMFRWEFATAVAGAILHINPFDQPDVQASKEITRQVLDSYVTEGCINWPAGVGVDGPELESALSAALHSAQDGDYVAFNAFLSYSEENRKMLEEIRTVVRDLTRRATTMGFGPRYLHSTGQIHKGGRNSGVFVVITADDEEDASIPGRPYSFGILKTAQSVGDTEALKKAGRRTLTIHLSRESELSRVLTALRSMSH